jgi:hypothetical protein
MGAHHRFGRRTVRTGSRTSEGAELVDPHRHEPGGSMPVAPLSVNSSLKAPLSAPPRGAAVAGDEPPAPARNARAMPQPPLDPVAWMLDHAPLDDEPETDDERRAVAHAERRLP